MCQCLLTFLKEVFLLLIASIASSKNSIIHVPCNYKVERSFCLTTFFVCATSVGGVFSLSGDSGSNIPLHCLQGTLASIMVVFCLLTPISSKLAKYTLDLQEVHISIVYTHFKITRSMLGLNILEVHDFIRLM